MILYRETILTQGRYVKVNLKELLKKLGYGKSVLKEELELFEPERRVLQFLFLLLTEFSYP